MAITSVVELPKRTGSLNQKNERSYTRVYQVTSNITDESALVVEASIGLTIGNPYVTTGGSDLLAVVIDFDTQQTSEDGLTWEVTVTYGQLDEPEEQPTLQETDVEWSFQQFQMTIDKDADGKAIRNSAGDPFQEAVERDDSRPVLTISRNEANFNAPLAYQFRDAVNADSFFGAPRGTVKVSSISASLQHDQTYGDYWRVTYAFHFDQNGFDAELLDMGFRERDGGELKNITIDGVPVQDPALLDGSGKKLPQGQQPVFRSFKRYPELPFSVFNF